MMAAVRTSELTTKENGYRWLERGHSEGPPEPHVCFSRQAADMPGVAGA